jgi:hypothetical protein
LSGDAGIACFPLPSAGKSQRAQSNYGLYFADFFCKHQLCSIKTTASILKDNTGLDKMRKTMRFRKRASWKTGSFIPLLLFAFILIFFGCAAKKKRVEGLSPYYPGPQIAVEPHVARLGIATLLKTPIRIGGMGFEPGDTVFIDMVSMEGEKPISIPVDSGDVDLHGGFTVEVSKEVKQLEILRLDIDPSNNKPIIVRSTIPPGPYILKAESVESDKKAECVIQFQPPSKMDRFKDWLQVKLRKIKKRK